MALGARQQVKIWKTGQPSSHYIAEISLNVRLNHNQPTNQIPQTDSSVVDFMFKERQSFSLELITIVILASSDTFKIILASYYNWIRYMISFFGKGLPMSVRYQKRAYVRKIFSDLKQCIRLSTTCTKKCRYEMQILLFVGQSCLAICLLQTACIYSYKLAHFYDYIVISLMLCRHVLDLTLIALFFSLKTGKLEASIPTLTQWVP